MTEITQKEAFQRYREAASKEEKKKYLDLYFKIIDDHFEKVKRDMGIREEKKEWDLKIIND
jgi:hypothetical protein